MPVIAFTFIALASLAVSTWVFESLIIGPFVWLLAWACLASYVVLCGDVE